MKKIIIASMARNGVIGRTSWRCGTCDGDGLVYGGAPPCCPTCNGTGRIPANDVPWSYLEIDEHFDRVTKGHAVIMGRRTWESRGGRPLKGRTNVVVSSRLFGEIGELTAGRFDRDVLDDLEDDLAKRCVDKLFVIGGARLFADALPLADELDLTLIDATHDGNVKFPWSTDSRYAASDLNPWAAYAFIETHGVRFDLVKQRQGLTPELTFTRWVRQ